MKNPKDSKLGQPTEPAQVLYVGAFSLHRIDDTRARLSINLPFENELLTAEEKAAYFEDLVKRNGIPNKTKNAKYLRQKAAKLKQQASQLDFEEAKPLIWKADSLEDWADQLEDTDDPETIAAQREPGFPDEADERPSIDEENIEFIQQQKEEKDRLKKQASFWKNIHSMNEDQVYRFLFGGPSIEGAPTPGSSDWSVALFVLAQRNNFALKVMASDMRASLNQVLELAKLGNEGAVTKLVEAVEDIIRQLNLCAKTHPVTVRNAASRLTHWPVMYSPHPKLRLNPEDVVKMVKLGSDFPRNLDPNAKWDPRELGCKIAIHLFKYVEMVKNNPEQYNHFPYCDAARKLPNFNEDCAGQRWWEVAKSVLTFSIPNLIADPYLSQLAKGKSNRKFPSRMEQKILERVNNRFMSLFYKQNR